MSGVHKVYLISDPVGDALAELVSSIAKTPTDVTIYTKDGPIRAHRSVLTLTSSMFRTLLTEQEEARHLYIGEKRSVVSTLITVLYNFEFKGGLPDRSFEPFLRFEMIAMRQRELKLFTGWAERHETRTFVQFPSIRMAAFKAKIRASKSALQKHVSTVFVNLMGTKTSGPLHINQQLWALICPRFGRPLRFMHAIPERTVPYHVEMCKWYEVGPTQLEYHHFVALNNALHYQNFNRQHAIEAAAILCRGVAREFVDSIIIQ